MRVIIFLNWSFQVKENGKIPVLDFLYSLPPKLRAKAFSDIELLRDMGGNLCEFEAVRQ